MSLDLSAAIEDAAREKAMSYAQQLAAASDLSNGQVGGLARGFHDGYLAAAPLIEAQVRAQIAAEIRAERVKADGPDGGYSESHRHAIAHGLYLAARIARGESS